MSNNVKDTNRKTTYTTVLMILLFNPNNIQIDEKWYKNVLLYYIEYVKIENSKYVKVNSVNPLYLMLNKINGYFEEPNGNNYLTLIPTNERKEKNKKVGRSVD